MLDDLAMEYLSLSDKMRKGYKDSLGTESQTWNETLSRQYTEKYPEHIEALTIKRIWISFQDIG